MLLVESALKGYTIEASDGRIGTVSDFLFDDRTWKLRWMVVDTGNWLTGRKVLLHPSAIRRTDYRAQEISVQLTRDRVKGSPDILSDCPVTQQMEADLHDHYGWDPLWGGGGFFGGYPIGLGLPIAPSPYYADSALLERQERAFGADNGDPHLRSMKALTGYHIHATDGEIGHVENFIIDDEKWDIRYLVADTRNWWPGQHVLLSPYAVQEISWSGHEVRVNLARARVKASPPWNPADLIDEVYQHRLHGYYAWPGYGW